MCKNSQKPQKLLKESSDKNKKIGKPALITLQ